MVDIIPVEWAETLGDGGDDEVDVQWQVAKRKNSTKDVEAEESRLSSPIIRQNGTELQSVPDETGDDKH